MGGASHRLAAGFLVAAEYQLNPYTRRDSNVEERKVRQLVQTT